MKSYSYHISSFLMIPWQFLSSLSCFSHLILFHCLPVQYRKKYFLDLWTLGIFSKGAITQSVLFSSTLVLSLPQNSTFLLVCFLSDAAPHFRCLHHQAFCSCFLIACRYLNQPGISRFSFDCVKAPLRKGRGQGRKLLSSDKWKTLWHAFSVFSLPYVNCQEQWVVYCWLFI